MAKNRNGRIALSNRRMPRQRNDARPEHVVWGAVSLGAVENLDQSQKSEGARCHSRY